MSSGKTKPAAGAAKARQVAKATGKRQPAETTLAELELRLLEISDLAGGGGAARLGSVHLHAKRRRSRAGSPGRDAQQACA